MSTPTENLNRLQALMAEARQTHAYKAQGASLEFTEDMVRLLQDRKMTQSELAQRIGVSPAYVTKILRGGTNFTLDTMVKIATALDAEFRCHLQRRGSETLWVDYTVVKAPRQSVSAPAGSGDADTCEFAFTPIKLPKHFPVSNEGIAPAA